MGFDRLNEYQSSLSRKPKRRKIVLAFFDDELREDSAEDIFILRGRPHSAKRQRRDDLARFKTDQGKTQGRAGEQHRTEVQNLLTH